MLGRSQMNAAPILGVLLVLFVGLSSMLRFTTIQIPQMVAEDCESCDETSSEPPVLQLHADGSMDIVEEKPVAAGIARRQTHVEARQVAATVVGLGTQNVVQLHVDDGVRWGDFVETVSSVSHITGGQVAVVSDED